MLDYIIIQLSEEIVDDNNNNNKNLFFLKLPTLTANSCWAAFASSLFIQAVCSVVTKIFMYAPLKISAKATKNHGPQAISIDPGYLSQTPWKPSHSFLENIRISNSLPLINVSVSLLYTGNFSTSPST